MMAQLYQWTVPCILCESPVEYHCNTCGDVLCPRCRDMHLKSNATKHHTVVPYSQRVEPGKNLRQCGDHPSHQCVVWCQTCQKAVCGECLISPSHKGHDFLKFEAKVEERRKEIQKEFDRYSSILMEWERSLQDLNKSKETYEKDIEKLDKEIVNRADQICKEVREVERKTRQQLQEMKNLSLDVLRKQEKSLTDGMQKIKQRIKELEDQLRNNDPALLLKYSSLEMYDVQPAKVDAPALPVFIPGNSNTKSLTVIFGNFSNQSEKMMSLVSQPSNVVIIKIAKYNYSFYSPALTSVSANQGWLRTDSYKLQLVNKDGTIENTIKISFYIFSMALTPQKEILLPDWDDKLIKSMSMKGDIKTLFETKWQPHGICSIPNGDIVVTFRDAKRIVHYSSMGKVIKELDRSLFQFPSNVAYNQVNQHLYVCDKATKSLTASGRLLAFNMEGQQQYVYTGKDAGEFTPTGICTDQAGRILITDYSSGKVHILDKDGRFLQYLAIEGGLTKPETIDVDSDGYAWIGERDTGKVKIVKYLEITTN